MMTTATAPVFAPGATFRNGLDGLHTNGANWSELMTVVRRDPTAYGAERYIVSDRNGRRAFALTRIAY